MTNRDDDGSTTRPGLYVGIDLGGTKIRSGLADAEATVLATVEVETDVSDGADLVEQIGLVVGELLARHGADSTDVVVTTVGGAGVPDQASGSLRLAPNLPLSPERSLVQELVTALGHPVLLDNDVNVAAVGELHCGIGLREPSFAFVSVGTGVGMGLVLHGHLVRGARGAAGEIGYLPLGGDPFDPEHQRHGPLEAVASGAALARQYSRRFGARTSGRELVDRAAAGDALALEVVDGGARSLALAVRAVVAVVDPGAVVFGGGVGGRVEFVQRVSAWLARLGVQDLPVHISEAGPWGPVHGAIRLGIDSGPVWGKDSLHVS